jgi:FdrA protein
MTTDHVELRAGAYADSVTLLQVSRQVQLLPGVVTAQVAMATPLNVEVLQRMGFTIPGDATVNHLVVAVRLDDAGGLEDVRAEVDRALTDSRRAVAGPSTEAAPRTTGAALLRDPGAVVLVSVPGPSAAVEAVDALEAGSDVMVFSDHVPVEQEVALKTYAAERGLLVMGPDCGTAVVDGVGLGFANVVAAGPVGIVAASGTGCQQVLALLDHAGVGVAAAYGVGGRDLSTAVGGLSTRTALARLDADPAVELALLVSKPPADEVAASLTAYADGLGTPVLSALLGPGRPDLTAATEEVLRRLGRDVPVWPVAGRAEPGIGTRLHGLFVGGTLKEEAAVLCAAAGADAVLVDFGDDDYTEGRAHPMIDPSLRLERLAEVAADPTTGVILLDVVLGHGAEDDPAASLAPALAGVRPPVVVAVVGTAHDPQDRDRQVAALVDAGAEVHLSNAGAARRALALLGGPA